MEQLKDLYTGELFRPRRKNQKFVSSKNRIDFHNTRTHQTNRLKAFISEPLNKNHKILMQLVLDIDKPYSYTKDFLKGKGINLSVMTHFETYDNKTVPALFNFIYLDLFENIPTLTIIRKS
jgi:hypothetical protein